MGPPKTGVSFYCARGPFGTGLLDRLRPTGQVYQIILDQPRGPFWADRLGLLEQAYRITCDGPAGKCGPNHSNALVPCRVFSTDDFGTY